MTACAELGMGRTACRGTEACLLGHLLPAAGNQAATCVMRQLVQLRHTWTA